MEEVAVPKELLVQMERQIGEIEASLSYYKEVAEGPLDMEHRYKGIYLKEHMLKQLYLLRKHTLAFKHGTHLD
ncbi:MAG: hypothetical protein ABIH34_04715 [Nanoarchaeota archaeon]